LADVGAQDQLVVSRKWAKIRLLQAGKLTVELAGKFAES
jgi:hypothetical protein